VDVANDPTLRELLQAARAWGVPLSTFLGAKRVTVHFYAEGGRLVRSETETEWTKDDREAALALMAYEADLCPGCGGWLEETTKPENEEKYRPKVIGLCHRCVALEQASGLKKNHSHPDALLVGVELGGGPPGGFPPPSST
jgi:hypothetical protein